MRPQVLRLLSAIDAQPGDELLLMGGSGAPPERHVPRLLVVVAAPTRGTF